MPRLALFLALLELTSPPDYDRVIAIEAPSPPEIVPEPAPAPAPTIEAPAPPSVPIPIPPPTIETDPVNYRIVLAGDVLIGLGGVGFVLMGAGLVVGSDAKTQRDALQVASEPDLDAIAKQERRVQLGDTLALIGGVSAAVLMSAGIGLIIGGRARERRRRDRLEILPTAMGLSLRF
ncbi:hypothetical protein ACNOYE_12310 [Nannocystaceae bacterium ST9]